MESRCVVSRRKVTKREVVPFAATCFYRLSFSPLSSLEKIVVKMRFRSDTVSFQDLPLCLVLCPFLFRLSVPFSCPGTFALIAPPLVDFHSGDVALSARQQPTQDRYGRTSRTSVSRARRNTLAIAAEPRRRRLQADTRASSLSSS